MIFFQIISEDQATNRTTFQSKNQEVNSHLYCPHDFPSNIEFRDDLPTLLGDDKEMQDEKKKIIASVINKLKPKGPTVKVFHLSNRKERNETSQFDQVKFTSPYKRYLAVLPFAEQERLAETVKLAEENRKRKLCPENNTMVRKQFFVSII